MRGSSFEWLAVLFSIYGVLHFRNIGQMIYEISRECLNQFIRFLYYRLVYIYSHFKVLSRSERLHSVLAERDENKSSQIAFPLIFHTA